MARYLFNLPDVQPSQKVRVDTASGSDSPATGLTTVAGDAISSTLTGNHGGELPEIFGPDGVATLYLKTLTYSGAVTGSPVTVPGYNETPVLPGSAAYSPAAVVPAPTGVGATDDANIRAAIATAQAAGIPVRFADGLGTSYRLLAPLPYSGLTYDFVPARTVQNQVNTPGYLADGDFSFVGGTVFKTDGTFSVFDDGQTDQGSVPTALGNTESRVRMRGVFGVDTAVAGIKAGAANVMGLVHSDIDGVVAKSCTWPVYLKNFAHITLGKVTAALCQNGPYFASDIPSATFIPGNSRLGEIYNLTPDDGRDNRLCRGIVFEAVQATSILNEMTASRLQANHFNVSLLSVTATFTNTSTAVAVPDGTKFAVGMPVNFSATGNGFTLGRTYFVLSVAGNNLTLGASRTGAAITATGSGTLTARSYGFPNVEVTTVNSGGRINNVTFPQMDLEGQATTAFHAENGNGNTFGFTDMPGTKFVDLSARNMTYCIWNSPQAVIRDLDGGSAGTAYFTGTLASDVQSTARGVYRDNTNAQTVLNLSGNANGDFENRLNNLIYPNTGLARKISQNDGTETLNGTQSGTRTYRGAGGHTKTLPTIVNDATRGASNLGLDIEFQNAGTGTLTIATDGTQLFNMVAAKTTFTIAAGAAAKVTANKDVSGNLFWSAVTLPWVA